MARGSSVHVRSASVPCHSHPVVTQVEDQLAALRSWSCNPGPNRMSLAHVRALLCLLDELLLLHQSSDVQVDLLLDGFLVLADAFGSFLAALLALRQYAAELRAAVRRHEHHKASAAARAQRQVGKEIQQLAAALTRSATSTVPPLMDVVSRTVAEAINHTAAASASVFVEVAALADAAAALAASPSSSSSSTSSNKKHKHKLPNLVLNASEKLKELDQCVAELESETEKVFRSLVQTRVSLLNIHTPTF